MTPVTVEIVATKGSAPRDAGTAMVVRAHETLGTIGGGALEYRAIDTARTLTALPFEEVVPLGPDLGQCCGGSVRLRYSHETRFVDRHQFLQPLPDIEPDATSRPLWVWGAGHVGRAVIRLAAQLRAFDITWVDSGPDRFPVDIPDPVTVLPAADMPTAVSFAPKDAAHLVFTYSHQIDFDLCARLLQHGFNSCGLIGSDTKKHRFFKRLENINLNSTLITCPIGDPARGKHPDCIAHSTLIALLQRGGDAEDSASDAITAVL